MAKIVDIGKFVNLDMVQCPKCKKNSLFKIDFPNLNIKFKLFIFEINFNVDIEVYYDPSCGYANLKLFK